MCGRSARIPARFPAEHASCRTARRGGAGLGHSLRKRRGVGCVVGAGLLALHGLGAEPARADFDPTLRLDTRGSTLRPTLQLDSALFFDRNAWFGKDEANAGGEVDFWSEWGVEFGLDGRYVLREGSALRARASGVLTTTRFGLDAAGSNFELEGEHPTEVTLEDAYLGWSSGSLFPRLGEDALDFSIGAQEYQVGSGFLFGDGATDGAKRGAYWLGPRQAFRLTAIARLDTGPFSGEIVYLQPNDRPATGTDVGGLNLEWEFGERATLGAGYWYVFDSEEKRRDGLSVFDLRGSWRPLARLPGLELSGEVVHQRNGSLNRSWAGFAELGYDFEHARWTPHVSLRYASFSGDREGEDRVEAFDPLFYGLDDWSTWYVGEIFGEFVGSNRNHEVYTARLRVEPAETLTLTLLYSYFRLDEFGNALTPRFFDERILDVRDRDLGHEVDLIADWEFGEHLSWSLVLGMLAPGRGLEQGSGGSSVWIHTLLLTTIRF